MPPIDIILSTKFQVLTLTPPINAQMPQNWPLGDSGGVKVNSTLHCKFLIFDLFNSRQHTGNINAIYVICLRF